MSDCIEAEKEEPKGKIQSERYCEDFPNQKHIKLETAMQVTPAVLERMARALSFGLTRNFLSDMQL